MDAGAGSGNASGAGASACCYYALLGIRKNASATDIRTAYRRLAMVSSPLPLFMRARRRAGVLIGRSLFWFPSRPADLVPISCRGRAEVAPGPVGEQPRRGRRGQPAVPADPGGLFR